MTTKELINQYVTAHADNRWMDASELEALLTEFAEQLMKDAVIIEDELVMCYNNGEPTGLSPYKEWWDTPEVQSRFKDGNKVKVIIIKE